MGTSLFNIAVSGLNAAQAGLSTTSHNITNASTPGYTRQQIEQVTNSPQFTGGGFLGQGTNVQTVQRVYNDFLTKQATAAQSAQGSLQAYSDQVSQVDNMLADAQAGLSPALQGFFSGVQGLQANPGSNPSSTPSRQALLSDAQTLVGSFNNLNQRLVDMQSNVNTQVQSTISSINDYAQQLVQLNQSIATAEVAGPSQPANDLHDQRDQVISQLSQLVGAQSISQSDGSLNVYIGNGIPLVVGTQAFALKATTSTSQPDQLEINLQTPRQATSSFPIGQLTGGTLGGLLDFQNGSLQSAESQLGQVAVSLAESFNNQHQLGVDLNGNQGKAFFNLGAIPVQTNSQNAASTTANIVSASYDSTNVQGLTASDYRVDYNGSGYQVTRLSDNTVVGSPPVTAAPIPPATTSTVTADGVTFSFAQGTVSSGDSFIVQPTRFAAGSISLAITDPNKVAAAAAARSSGFSTNSGSATIAAPTLYSATNMPGLVGAGGITMSYAGGNLTFAGLPSSTAMQVTHADGTKTQYTAAALVASPVVPFAAGDIIALAPTSPPTSPATGDLSFQFTGTPTAGDKFTLSLNSGASSDNTNALALGQLQTTNIMNGGKTTFQSAYAQLVGTVGNTTRDKQVNLTAQNSTVTQLQASQQSVSGVNLDEEAANLIRYQQAYQAAGKIITVAGKLFDQLLSL